MNTSAAKILQAALTALTEESASLSSRIGERLDSEQELDFDDFDDFDNSLMSLEVARNHLLDTSDLRIARIDIAWNEPEDGEDTADTDA
jgi:hypothetical protein